MCCTVSNLWAYCLKGALWYWIMYLVLWCEDIKTRMYEATIYNKSEHPKQVVQLHEDARGQGHSVATEVANFVLSSSAIYKVVYPISFTSDCMFHVFWKSFRINFNVIFQYAIPQQYPLPIFSDNFIAFSFAIRPEILHSDFSSSWFLSKIQTVSHSTQAGWIVLLVSSGVYISNLEPSTNYFDSFFSYFSSVTLSKCRDNICFSRPRPLN
jgi:hypothetical protein